MKGAELKTIRESFGLLQPAFGELLWDLVPYTKKRKNLGVYMSWYEKGKKPIPQAVQDAVEEMISAHGQTILDTTEEAPDLLPEIDEEAEDLFRDNSRRNVMRLAWELRRHYASVWNCDIMEIAWGECMRLAWASNKMAVAA